MNPFEQVCREWLKGCSCAENTYPEECENCTRAFLAKILELGTQKDGKSETPSISYELLWKTLQRDVMIELTTLYKDRSLFRDRGYPTPESLNVEISMLESIQIKMDSLAIE